MTIRYNYYLDQITLKDTTIKFNIQYGETLNGQIAINITNGRLAMRLYGCQLHHSIFNF